MSLVISLVITLLTEELAGMYQGKYWASFRDASLAEGSWASWMLVFTTLKLYIRLSAPTYTRYAHTEVMPHFPATSPTQKCLFEDEAVPSVLCCLHVNQIALMLPTMMRHLQPCYASVWCHGGSTQRAAAPLLLKASGLLVHFEYNYPYTEKGSVYVCERKTGDV